MYDITVHNLRVLVCLKKLRKKIFAVRKNVVKADCVIVLRKVLKEYVKFKKILFAQVKTKLYWFSGK